MPGPSVFPSREPGVSGDFWASQQDCQGPFRPSGPLSILGGCHAAALPRPRAAGPYVTLSSVRQRERPGLHSQAVAWPPRISAGRRPPGSQASSRGEAKDSALLSSRDAGLLEPPERPGLEARFPARRREERGCGPVTGKDRASCQSGGAPALRPGAIARGPWGPGGPRF